MRERRVQAVLLRQKLGEVFVVVLHFELRERESVSVQQQKKREKPQQLLKKVFQLCNYGVPRIRCADGALHVATGRFCDGLVLYFASLWLSNPLEPSFQQLWLTGTEEGTKAVRDTRVVIQHKPAEVSSAEGRSCQD